MLLLLFSNEKEKEKERNRNIWKFFISKYLKKKDVILYLDRAFLFIIKLKKLHIHRINFVFIYRFFKLRLIIINQIQSSQAYPSKYTHIQTQRIKLKTDYESKLNTNNPQLIKLLWRFSLRSKLELSFKSNNKQIEKEKKRRSRGHNSSHLTI